MQAPLTQAPLDQAVLSRESIPAYPGYRIFTEQIFPRLAKELKLKEGWDYKDLYLSILEDLAKQYRISRFKIYTVEELLRLIHKKAGTAALKAMIPVLDSGTQV